jgi:hypothetical protein
MDTKKKRCPQKIKYHSNEIVDAKDQDQKQTSKDGIKHISFEMDDFDSWKESVQYAFWFYWRNKINEK